MVLVRNNMYIIVGLGNPGQKYKATRHNIGFMAVDYIAEKYKIKMSKIKHKAIIGEGRINGHKVILVKPQTYMNLSGESVLSLVNYYQIPLTNLLTIYDDIDLEVGVLRIRHKGSAGTHNGMRHIIYMLKNQDFPRIRIGIGKSDVIPLRDFVTSNFLKDEILKMEDAVIRSCKVVETMLDESLDKAMNLYNG